MSTPSTSRRRFIQAGCGVVACGGMDAMLPQFNLISTALAQTAPSGYKALVCLYMDGGNDSWNLLIPNDPVPHDRYVNARNGLNVQANGQGVLVNTSGLAFPRSDDTRFVDGATLPRALAIGNGQFALNPFVADPTNADPNRRLGLETLFAENKLAFVANIGTLVDPLTRATYNARRKPPQLYSHNDQSNLWHLGGGSSSQAAQGWGGRVAGAVAVPASQTQGLPPTISISGQTRFLIGRTPTNQPLFPFSLSTSNTTPATSLGNYSATSTNTNQFQPARRAALQELFAAANPHPFTSEYQDIMDRALQLSDVVINPSIASIPASDVVNGGGATGFSWPNTGLGNQLRQVAKMIRISRPGSAFAVQPINANRQVFFVRIGGFDTHDGQITSATAANAHHGLLRQISQAVYAFQRAMTAIGAENEVTLFTSSDFARTINSNGNGTDHAWGGVQFVVGGAVNGGQVYGRYPAMILNNSLSGTVSVDANYGECFSRGQFLPTTAVDQLAASLARWMGVPDSDLPAIFPNIDNFTGGLVASTPTFAYANRVIPNLISGIA